MGSCDNFNDLSNKVFNSNKTGINKLKTLRKYISCEWKFKFDGRKCNSDQKSDNDKCRCNCKNPKNHHVCKKDYIWYPATCSCKNGKYASIISNSIIAGDEIIDETTKTVTTKIV